jgi:hypothetical protein
MAKMANRLLMDPARKKLHVNGVYQSRKSAADLKADLEALCALDKKSEGEIKRWGRVKTCGGAGVLLGSLGMAFLFMAVGLSWIHVPLFLLFAAGITYFIIANRRITVSKRDEFPDYRYLACLELVNLLEADTGSDTVLDVALNLKEAGVPKKSRGRKPNSYTGRGKVNWKQEETQEQFLIMRGRLRDSTKFAFTLVEEVHAYGEHYPYRALSGKTKTKLRARKRIRWKGTLSLKFKGKRYAINPDLQAQAPSFIQLPDGARAKKITATESELGMTALTAVQKFKAKRKQTTNISEAWEDMTVDENATSIMLSHFSAMMFLSLYQILNASKREKAQS